MLTSPDFNELLRILERNKVRYLVLHEPVWPEGPIYAMPTDGHRAAGPTPGNELPTMNTL